MKTAILTVGTEILFGQIVNTNAAFLSQQLNNLGYDVMYHYTVGDNPGRLAELIHLAFRDCDLILLIENGKIVEKGSHEELMRLDGSYAKMYRTQMGIAG